MLISLNSLDAANDFPGALLDRLVLLVHVSNSFRTPKKDAQKGSSVQKDYRINEGRSCGLSLAASQLLVMEGDTDHVQDLDVGVTAERYAGPAALAYAERVLEEPRGAETANLLAWADDPDGVWRCHAIFECAEACPSGVNPAARIMSLRGSLLGRRLRAQRRSEATE